MFQLFLVSAPVAPRTLIGRHGAGSLLDQRQGVWERMLAWSNGTVQRWPWAVFPSRCERESVNLVAQLAAPGDACPAPHVRPERARHHPACSLCQSPFRLGRPSFLFPRLPRRQSRTQHQILVIRSTHAHAAASAGLTSRQDNFKSITHLPRPGTPFTKRPPPYCGPVPLPSTYRPRSPGCPGFRHTRPPWRNIPHVPLDHFRNGPCIAPLTPYLCRTRVYLGMNVPVPLAPRAELS